MSDFDATSRYAHLITLSHEYQELIDSTEMGGLETEEIRYLNGQRSVLHDQIMEEMMRLGMHFTDRGDAMRKAIKLARWQK
ncbi:MAG: hypothetical protein EI684_10510 [Candidatus Viridilinea halotolerans]|uniref:Uncharacterized protein n=1 Tax=Candidatus Viridilinea halotolerans TaxID=2491704 RepID=A0A426U042_9CHLR|nr:MAG: hypothetical protein EI684_10510 [Candidatus Viridilinea halotolerans]